jgi:hypothetical protein
MLTKEKLNVLQEIYNKENLDKGLFTLVKKFYLHHPYNSWQDISAQTILNKLSVKKTFNKTEMAEISFSVFSNSEVYEAFSQSLPKPIQLLIEKLLWRESISDAEVFKLTGESMVNEINTSYHKHREVKKEYYFFTVTADRHFFSYNSPTAFTLSLHPELKKILIEFYPKPAHYNFIPLDEIAETRFRFSAEQSIMQELPRVISYYMQQAIKYSANGRPMEPTLPKMQKHCLIIEFYEPQYEALTKTRTMLMAGMLFGYKANNISATTTELLKDLFNKNYFKLYTSPFVLQQLKGWGYLNDSAFNAGAEENMQAVLKELQVNKWVSYTNLIELVQSRQIDIRPIYPGFVSNYLYYSEIIKTGYSSYTDKKNIGHIEYNRFITEPFVKGSVFLYAAFGLIEIAYADINTSELGSTFYSGYDGLMYCRLTPLGAYVLGLTKSYDAPDSQQKNTIQLSDDSLVILAEGDTAVINVMLANYAEKLANNRYRVTNGYFLKDCKNRKDIENKIALFKNTVGINLPPLWEKYFSELLSNAKAIKQQNQITILRLPADRKELHRLIAQDAILKQIVLKAENYYILIANTDVAKFKSRMKEFGYIAE